jgi:hypothetical protein
VLPKAFHGCPFIVAQASPVLPVIVARHCCPNILNLEAVVCIEGAVESARGQERLAQQTAFFRAFILSRFRDPPGSYRFLRMKDVDQSRKHES